MNKTGFRSIWFLLQLRAKLLGTWKRDHLERLDPAGMVSDINAAQEARRENGAKSGVLAKSGLL